MANKCRNLLESLSTLAAEMITGNDSVKGSAFLKDIIGLFAQLGKISLEATKKTVACEQVTPPNKTPPKGGNKKVGLDDAGIGVLIVGGDPIGGSAHSGPQGGLVVVAEPIAGFGVAVLAAPPAVKTCCQYEPGSFSIVLEGLTQASIAVGNVALTADCNVFSPHEKNCPGTKCTTDKITFTVQYKLAIDFKVWSVTINYPKTYTCSCDNCKDAPSGAER
jgi:hypothetical protein